MSSRSLALAFVGLMSVVLLPACDKAPEADCSTDVPAFADVAVWPKCVTCHATTLTGDARGGAPEDINFDDYASAKSWAAKALSEVNEGAMPPDGEVTEEELQSLTQWVECGTPE